MSKMSNKKSTKILRPLKLRPESISKMVCAVPPIATTGAKILNKNVTLFFLVASLKIIPRIFREFYSSERELISSILV
jgi:hypothetical protein